MREETARLLMQIYESFNVSAGWLGWFRQQSTPALLHGTGRVNMPEEGSPLYSPTPPYFTQAPSKCASISSSVFPFVSGRNTLAVMK
jgi:hypothetical protein